MTNGEMLKRIQLDVAGCMAAMDGTGDGLLGGMPESHLYMLMDMDLDRWNRVRGIIVNAGWVS